MPTGSQLARAYRMKEEILANRYTSYEETLSLRRSKIGKKFRKSRVIELVCNNRNRLIVWSSTRSFAIRKKI